MMQRISAKPSVRRKKYEPWYTRNFVPINAFTELSIGNIKKVCECFNNMPENSCDVLASDCGPSCSRLEQLKGKSFIWSGFLRMSNHTVKKENVTQEVRLPEDTS